MPPVIGVNVTRAKPAFRIIAGEFLGRGKLADQFHEIAIGLGVAGDHAADLRDRAKGIEFIQLVEPRHVDVDENSRQRKRPPGFSTR